VKRGAYVTTISRRTAGELCNLRVLLAVHAARPAAERALPEEIAKVSRLMEAIERAARRGKLVVFCHWPLRRRSGLLEVVVKLVPPMSPCGECRIGIV